MMGTHFDELSKDNFFHLSVSEKKFLMPAMLSNVYNNLPLKAK